ncbi:MAG: precorrin-8X methylmutase [Oscillospiraceae bacterium]|nr:precorrin-8X methylmutase [Oscillospiraceae bacterium]
MSIELEHVRPADIEKRSMEIIESELSAPLDPVLAPVIRRVIHTTADFDYVKTLVFSESAVEKGVQALKNGVFIVTDTTMAQSGINKRVLKRFGGEVLNFIGDPDVAAEAKARGITRSAVSMERAASLGVPLIYVVGNAPTALVSIYEQVQAGTMPPPALVVGVPVGFVNVVEAKELILKLDVPYIVARGRKGGSNVAAAIINALLYIASSNERE